MKLRTIPLAVGASALTLTMENKPFAANTVESCGYKTYNKHAAQPFLVGHWIVVYAYSSPTGLVTLATWVDPAAGRSRPSYVNSATMFNETPANMRQFLVHPYANGISH